MSVLIPVIIAAVVIVGLVVLLLSIRRIAEPDEALVISGVSAQPPEGADESMGFKIITGRGCFVWPFIQKARTLGLNLHEAQLDVRCVTSQGIPIIAQGVVIYKVGDDLISIANAARRFLGQQEKMDGQVHSVFAGHLRSIIGNLTVEELIGKRDKLEQETREASFDEMAKLGLIIDSLKIQEIGDPSNYIKNLAQPHIAQVEKTARIAQAANNREAAEREAEATALVAAAQRDASIKQAGFQAEVEQAQAKASQAGPRAEAEARQAVVQQETAVAQLEAERTERRLDAEVRKPADAERYRQVQKAEADRETTILTAQAEAQRIKLGADAEAEQTRKVGEAQGAAIAAKGKAEGDALKARADGLAANQDAVIGQQVAERLPDIVAAAARPFEHINNLTVLNGAQGLMDALNSVMATGMQSLHTVRSAMNTDAHTNGKAPEKLAGVGDH